MTKILYVLIAIVMLGFITFAHELGHFIMGRLCGIGVAEFAVGMGPRLFGFTHGGIEYSVRALPLGGFCRFVDEDENTGAANGMNSQSVWKRFLTVFAGPAMNFVLAFVFCTILLSDFIIKEYQPRITHLEEDMPAATSGLQIGDIIEEINGTRISYDKEGITALKSVLAESDLDQDVRLIVRRGDEDVSINLRPARVTDDATGETVYQIGISFGGRTYRFGEALSASCGYMVSFTKSMLSALKDLIFKGEGVDDMRGPVGMISFMSDLVYDEKLFAVVNLIFVLSLNLGIMNLLPLPALDGGHLMFLIIEAIRRKPIPPEKEGMVHAIGFALLMCLILFITYKDILRLFTGG